MPKKKATFQPTVRPDWAGAMEYISETEQSQMFQAILMFPAIDLPNSAYWNKTIKPDLQNQYETFISSCKKKEIGVRKRWENTKGIDMNTNVIDNYTDVSDKNTNEQDMKYIVKDKDKNKDKDIISKLEEEELKKIKNPRFVKPTLEQIRDYCKERNNNIDAEYFYDYYERNGWKVSKNPMKDWRACVRTWERNNFNRPPQKAKSISSPDYVGEGSFLRRAEDDPFCADL